MPQEIKILSCIRSMNPEHGGPADFVKSLHQMQYQDFSLEIACMDSPESSWLKGLEPIRAEGPGALGSYSLNLNYLKWLQANSGRFDLLLVHGLWDFVSVAATLSAKASSVPVAVFVHGMLDPWFNEAYPLKKLKKEIYWKLVQSSVLSSARAVLFNSEVEMLRAQNVFQPYKLNAVLVPYGVPPGNYDLSQAKENFYALFPQLKERKFFLFFGRITQKKGLDLLIRAFSSLRPEGYCLVIAGPNASDYAQELSVLAQDLAISEHLLWTGMMSGESKWGALAAADLFILPSQQENFARAMAESLAAGTPVLLSNKVNTWSIVSQYKAGLVCEANEAGTRESLIEWMNMSASEKQEMRTAAFTCFKNELNLETKLQPFLDAMRKLIN